MRQRGVAVCAEEVRREFRTAWLEMPAGKSSCIFRIVRIRDIWDDPGESAEGFSGQCLCGLIESAREEDAGFGSAAHMILVSSGMARRIVKK